MLLKSTLLALTIVFPTNALAQGSVAGNWDITFQGPQGPTTINVAIQQDGEKVTGELASPFGSVPLTGTISNDLVNLAGSVELQGQKIDVLVAAKLDGDALDGTVTIGGLGELPFKGKRAAAQAVPGAPAPTSTPTPSSGSGGDAAGKWNIEILVLGNKLLLTAILEQDGEKVSGTVATFAGKMPASGTMTGKALKLQFTAQVPPFGEYQITMTGDLGADGFAGKATVAGMGETDWTGRRAKE